MGKSHSYRANWCVLRNEREREFNKKSRARTRNASKTGAGSASSHSWRRRWQCEVAPLAQNLRWRCDLAPPAPPVAEQRTGDKMTRRRHNPARHTAFWALLSKFNAQLLGDSGSFRARPKGFTNVLITRSGPSRLIKLPKTPQAPATFKQLVTTLLGAVITNVSGLCLRAPKVLPTFYQLFTNCLPTVYQLFTNKLVTGG